MGIRLRYALELVYSPPCWLLLERPEYLDDGLDDWERVYASRLEVFLQELRMREDVGIWRGVTNICVRAGIWGVLG